MQEWSWQQYVIVMAIICVVYFAQFLVQIGGRISLTNK